MTVTSRVAATGATRRVGTSEGMRRSSQARTRSNSPFAQSTTRRSCVMRNRASSFPVDTVAPAWYRQRWPWLLVAGPSLVVVASLASAWIAVKSDDGVVAEDYYRQGLLINQKLAREMPAEQAHGATISVIADRSFRIRLYGGARPPTYLLLTLAPPRERGDAGRVRLRPRGAAASAGALLRRAPRAFAHGDLHHGLLWFLGAGHCRLRAHHVLRTCAERLE